MIQRFLHGIMTVLPMAAVCVNAEEAKPEKVSFYSDIRPVFQAQCHGCHQPAKDKGDYIMTSFKEMLAGGESEEKAIVPKHPEKSYLFSLITSNEEGEIEMPKGKDAKPLHETEVALVRQWIAEGAVDDTPEGAKVRYDMDNPPIYTQAPVITSLDFSPDGELLAVAGFHEVLLHKADGSGLVARLVGLAERIESVRFSPDGKLLAVTGGQPARMGEVQVWDVKRKILKLSVPVTFDTIYGASWSPNGKLISFGCGDNTLRAIDAKTGEQVLYQGAHSDWVFDTIFSVKGDYVVSVGRDRSAKLTELKTQRFIDNITSITPGALAGGLASVVRHPERDEILVGGADGTPKLYRMHRTTARKIGDDANLIRKFPNMDGRVFAVDFSADGKRIAAANSYNGVGTVAIYGVKFDSKVPDDLKKIFEKQVSQRSPEEQKKVEAYQTADVGPPLKASFQAPMYAVSFRPDGKVLAAAGYDGLIRLIDTVDGKISKEFMPMKIDESALVISDDKGSSTSQQILIETTKEALPNGVEVTTLNVQPEQIRFNRVSDYAQLLVTAKLSTGDDLDVTRMVRYEINDDVAAVSPSGMLRPRSDGKSALKVSFAGHSVTLPVEITGMEEELRVDFIRDVMPVLGKAGCNSGLCHGAKKGKAGFRLSLRGNDPAWDTVAFTDDIASRRVNRASPHDSLMLLKASSAVPHEGKDVAPRDSLYYRIIHKWIADGANLDRKSKRVARIDIFPKNPIIQLKGGRQQFRVTAIYPDGNTADVTAEAFIQAGVIDVAESDKTGLITALRRGESPVLARYEGAYAATTLTVMGDRTGFTWADSPKNNFIDELVAAKLKRTKTLPSDLCSDAEFIRRIHLDMTGLPPTVDQLRQFLADKRPTHEKRDSLIDRLIGNDAFVDHWTNKWADLLQSNSKYLGGEGAKAFHGWIRQQVKDNVPYDKFAYQVLTASGSNKENPPASYYKIHRTPEDTMENTTHLFLGVRFSCNKCHDHPFERWVQDQYYETAAYFAQVGLKKDPVSGKKTVGGTAVEGSKPLYEVVYDKNEGEVKHEATGLVAPPKFPFKAKYEVPEKATRREQLARWVISPDNQYFAKSFVNRMWGYLLGTGIIEPLDDIRAGNPPTNPELLEKLTKTFISSGHDTRQLIRTICQSRTYQLSIVANQWNDDDQINYSHAMARRLPAEALYDSIYQVTGTQSKLPGVPPGTRAAQLPDSGIKEGSGFLTTFGRPPRESPCECERAGGMQFGPVMALVTGPTVNAALSDPKNALVKMVQENKDDHALVNELYLRILNRPATDTETKVGIELMKSIEPEHQILLKELARYEQDLKPVIARREAARQEDIVRAKKMLQDYEKSIAAREAEADKKQKDAIAAAEKVLQDYEETVPARFGKWVRIGGNKTPWTVLEAKELKSKIGTTLTKEKEGVIFATGKNGKDTFTITAESRLSTSRGESNRATNSAFRNAEIYADEVAGEAESVAAEAELITTKLAAELKKQETDLVSKLERQAVVKAQFAKLISEKLGPAEAKVAAANAASAKAPIEKANADKAMADVNVEVKDALEAFLAAEMASQSAEVAVAATQKTADRASLQTEALGKRKAAKVAKTVLDKLIAEKQEVVQARVARANAAFDAAPINKSNAEKELNPLKAEAAKVKGDYETTQKAVADAGKSIDAIRVAQEKAKADSNVKRDEAVSKRATAKSAKSALAKLKIPGATIGRFTGLRIEALMDKRLPKNGPGRAPNDGNFVLTELELYWAPKARPDERKKIALENARADFSQSNYDVKTAIDGKLSDVNNGWAVSPQKGRDHLASFDFKEPIKHEGDIIITVVMKQEHQDNKFQLGKFRLSLTDSAKPLDFGLPKNISDLLAIVPVKRDAKQNKMLLDHFRGQDIGLKKHQTELANSKKSRPTDPKLMELREKLARTEKPLLPDPGLVDLKRAVDLSTKQLDNKRLYGVQDIAWALINNPAFLFNR